MPIYAKNNVDVGNVLSSIQMLLKYYQSDYKNLNLDGFFGLRVLEGQIELLISEHSLGLHRQLSNETLKQIIALKEETQNLTALGLEAVKHDDAKYFRTFNPIVSEPWKVIKPHRKLDPTLRWEIPQYKAKLKFMRKNFTEETSDKCMSEVLRSNNQSCVLSFGCVKLMTSRGFTGYPITHQLLWSMLVEAKPQCLLAVKQPLQQLGLKSIDDMQLELCTNNFYEMVAVVEVLMHGYVHKNQQDLFLEQQFVCPSLGFYEFLKKDYLSQIISWQFPTGCFGDLDDGQEEDESDLVDLSSLLEEYNGDKLKFVPEMTGYHVGVHKKHGKNFSQQHAVEKKKLLSENLLNIGNRKQARTKLSELKADASQQRIMVIPENKKQQRDSILRQMTSSLPKPKPAFPGSIHHRLAINEKDMVNKDTALFRADGVISKSSMPGQPFRVGRHLLMEKKMAGGCLSHKTGVAAGALVMYLRYMIDPGNIKWEGQHDLLLSDTRSLLQVKADRPDPEEDDDQMDDPDLENEDEYADEEGAAAGIEKREEDKINKESNMSRKVLPLPYNKESGENKDNGNHDKTAEDETYEGGDEADEQDEADKAPPDDYYRSDEDTNDKPEYDSDGNPVAPKGRIIAKSEKDSFKESIIEKHVGIHAERNKAIEYLIQDEDPPMSLHETGQELKGVKIKSEDKEKEEEEEGHFYDDESEAEIEGSINRKIPLNTQRPPSQNKNQPGTLASETLYLGGRDPSFPDQPNYTVLMLVSVAPLFILMFFLFKFVRKRRVHIRYHF
ncbi:UPF0764 protein C16orf89-like protein [Elysia marginata]|uniref:UPF0764 protein C16orf89-like protein n=1 Tax=Elysia marginata TaxID=1093978 RepID=A0AAV4GCA5_9GAST|nr:UPF0764 protein C16orf89-like protein [Elysia marginata]